VSDYLPITDTSLDGRRVLIEEHGVQIRLLLDATFLRFFEENTLAPFGFRTDTPVNEAVDWVVDRFTDANFDMDTYGVKKSTQLFTHLHFWLTQKVGKQAYKACMARAKNQAEYEDDRTPHEDTNIKHLESGVPEQTEALEQLKRRLGGASERLRKMTCSDLVGFWLWGTEKVRSRLLGWGEQADISEQGLERSKKEQSFYRYDARFRFVVLLLDVLPDPENSQAEAAVVVQMFKPCANTPSYMRSNEAVGDEIGERPRQVGVLRKKGLRDLLDTCISKTAHDSKAPADILPIQRLIQVFVGESLGPTTLSVYQLDSKKDDSLKRKISKLPRMPRAAAT
jgi:hypothetical protein